MKKSEALELVAALVAAYPTPEWPDETVELYANRLMPHPADSATKAIMALIDQGGTYRPSIGQVRERILEADLGDLPSPNVAWAEVMEQMNEPERLEHDGARLDPHPPMFSHDLIAHALASFPGGVDRIVAVAQGKSLDWSVAPTFKDHYVEVCQRVKATGELPGGVRPQRRDVKREIETRERRQIEAAEAAVPALTAPGGGKPPHDPDDGGRWAYDPDVDLNTGRVVGWYRAVPPTPRFVEMHAKLAGKEME